MKLSMISFYVDVNGSNVYDLIYIEFAVQSMLAIWPGLSLKYDMKMYMKYADALIEKCASLRGDEDDNDDDHEDKKDEEENGFVVTPWTLGECLWTEYMMNKDDEKKKKKDVDTKETKKSRKRKLSDDENDSTASQRVKRLRL